MDQMNFHKQKLFALIVAAIALISLLLPWVSVNFLMASESWNGFRSWGILSFFGILAVVGLTFYGNRKDQYTPDFRKYVLVGFAAVTAGAILFLLRINSGGSDGIFNDMVRAGAGLWICLIAGLAGIAIVYGLIKISNRNT
jgi:hypothetical protein